MLWTQKPPITNISHRRLAYGTIPIDHAETGQPIALVLPQSRSGDTQMIANLLERAPEVIRTARALDRLLKTPAADIYIANALRDLRKAMAGIELED